MNIRQRYRTCPENPALWARWNTFPLERANVDPGQRARSVELQSRFLVLPKG